MQESVLRTVTGIIAAWQLRSAILHVEFKWCDGAVKVIEAACRIGGDMISTLVEMRYGVSLEECIVLMRCRRDVGDAFARHTPEGDGYYYGVKFLFSGVDAMAIPAGVELQRVLCHNRPDPGPGAGFDAEQRLGSYLLRVRDADVMKAFIGAFPGQDAVQAKAA